MKNLKKARRGPEKIFQILLRCLVILTAPKSPLVVKISEMTATRFRLKLRETPKTFIKRMPLRYKPKTVRRLLLSQNRAMTLHEEKKMTMMKIRSANLREPCVGATVNAEQQALTRIGAA
jgi:hypothetical protein